ncbi:unnamed protein product [Closterium sp. Naga37s-1]|nr:unnamed protein product [Closterium sp. Naga37s-1]
MDFPSHLIITSPHRLSILLVTRRGRPENSDTPISVLLPRIPSCCCLPPLSTAAAAPPLRPLLLSLLPRLAPSAMARMTAVAMLLPGLLAGLAIGAAIAAVTIISIMPLDKNACCRAPVADDANATAMCQNGTCRPHTPAHSIAASPQHAHALNSPGGVYLLVLYSAIATLMALLWGMGVTHTQVRAWVHQHGLAVAAGLMKLKSASKGLVAMEMRMRALGVQLEETRRELEEAERRREVEMREMKGQLEETKREFAADLAAAKVAMTEQWNMTDRGSDLARRGNESRKGEENLRVELAREREEMIQDLKMNIELEISQSEGDRKAAWQVQHV